MRQENAAAHIWHIPLIANRFRIGSSASPLGKPDFFRTAKSIFVALQYKFL
jgi:hypothetical protein